MTAANWFSLAIGTAVQIAINIWVIRKFRERKRIKEAGDALEKRLENNPEERLKRTVYNPKPYRKRLTVAGKPYDPEKHFRCDGRTDRKW